MSIVTVQELVSNLKANARGTSKENYDYLKSLVGPGVTITSEARVKDAPTNNENDMLIGRIILTVNAARDDLSREVARYCNGLVLWAPTWDVLVLPPPVVTKKYRVTNIVKKLPNCTVYKVNDGTMVTLYWFQNEWRMSSIKGFDVTNFKWIGERTYMEAFCEVAPDFDFETLDQNRCYTIGFRHWDFHPLTTDPQRAWIVHSCDVSKLNAGGELSTSYEPMHNLEGQAVVSATTLQDFNDLRSNVKNALDVYMGSAHTTPIINYGYIIRGGNTNVMLESSLLKKIRFVNYNIPKTEYVLTERTRREYVIMRAYIGYDKYVFINMFPQFKCYYAEYDNAFATLTKRIISAMRNRANRNNINKALESTNGDFNTRVDKLASILVNQVEEFAQVNVLDAQGPAIVTDLIMNQKYLKYYVDTFIINKNSI